MDTIVKNINSKIDKSGTKNNNQDVEVFLSKLPLTISIKWRFLDNDSVTG